MPVPPSMTEENKNLNETLRLGEFEELILLAITGLQAEAYGSSIRERLQAAGRSVSPGALYATLGRLEEKGLISTHSDAVNSQQRGRPKAAYTVTEIGQGALRAVEEVRARLRGDLPSTAASASESVAGVLLSSQPVEPVTSEPLPEDPAELPLEPVTLRASNWQRAILPNIAPVVTKPRKSPPAPVPWKEREKKAASETKTPTPSAFPSIYDSL